MPKICDWLNIIISHSSKSIWVTILLFCQNDSPIRRSFWQKDSLITHILFELWLIMIFSPMANFGHHPLVLGGRGSGRRFLWERAIPGASKVSIISNQNYLYNQGWRKVKKFGGASRNVVGIIFPLVGIGLTDLPNTEGASGTPGSGITFKVHTYALVHSYVVHIFPLFLLWPF
jgi:hypothetical protein